MIYGETLGTERWASLPLQTVPPRSAGSTELAPDLDSANTMLLLRTTFVVALGQPVPAEEP